MERNTEVIKESTVVVIAILVFLGLYQFGQSIGWLLTFVMEHIG